MDLARRSLNGPALEEAELLPLLGSEVPLLALLHESNVVRSYFYGNRVRVQILNNAQNARCSEDCGYCSQSAVTKAPVRPYAWKPVEDLLEGARAAHAAGAFRYCIVASGRSPTERQLEHLIESVRTVKASVPVEICVSVGLVDEDRAARLRDAGVDRLNHNLNTSERRYGEICSTHTYQDRVRTLLAAKAVGLASCSGLIIGIGESDRDIVEVALELRKLGVPSIPVNALIPIDGNPIRSDGSLTPERILRVLCVMRLANPSSEIRIAAGREGHLRSLEALSLYPANSLFVEGYLTTKGRSSLDTYRMIRDAGFVVERADGAVVSWEEIGLDEAYRIEGLEDILKDEVRARIP